MASLPVALVLGAGANIGYSVGRVFAAKGYKVALVSRSAKEEDSGPNQLNIRGDFSNPESIPRIFERVKSKLGTPCVVIYNASSGASFDAKNPLGVPLADFTRDVAINTTSLFMAAKQAVQGFQDLPDSASRTFIYTGNICNVSPIVQLMDLGVGKSASAHIIQCAAEAYKNRGFKFYYADQRNSDGSAVYGDIDGPAHGKFYAELSEGRSQSHWHQTFVKDAGYQNFQLTEGR